MFCFNIYSLTARSNFFPVCGERADRAAQTDYRDTEFSYVRKNDNSAAKFYAPRTKIKKRPESVRLIRVSIVKKTSINYSVLLKL